MGLPTASQFSGWRLSSIWQIANTENVKGNAVPGDPAFPLASPSFHAACVLVGALGSADRSGDANSFRLRGEKPHSHRFLAIPHTVSKLIAKFYELKKRNILIFCIDYLDIYLRRRGGATWMLFWQKPLWR